MSLQHLWSLVLGISLGAIGLFVWGFIGALADEIVTIIRKRFDKEEKFEMSDIKFNVVTTFTVYALSGEVSEHDDLSSAAKSIVNGGCIAHGPHLVATRTTDAILFVDASYLNDVEIAVPGVAIATVDQEDAPQQLLSNVKVQGDVTIGNISQSS